MAFRDWGYELAKNEYGAQDLDGGPWQVINDDGHELIVKDVIADAFLQQILLRPSEYDIIATLNLNGDYISDALAAIVGGIGIAPGANINYTSGHAKNICGDLHYLITLRSATRNNQPRNGFLTSLF